MTVTEQDEVVAALLGIPGVAAAAIQPADDNPGTLRLELAQGADEVWVAGQVNHVLRERFGLAVDTDRVQVVETPPPEPAPGSEDVLLGGWPAAPSAEPPVEPAGPRVEPAQPTDPTEGPDARSERPAAAGRVVIQRVQLVSASLSTTVHVTLSAAGRSANGSAEGTATATSLNRAVASAALRALEGIVGEAVRFDVEHVELAETGSDRTALVVVTMVTERATQRLSGASVVREDASQAVIRGVLAAVNRRLAAFLPR